MKLNRDQLTKKLTGILKETDPALIPDVRNILTEAIRGSCVPGTKLFKYRENALIGHFNVQMETIKSILKSMKIPSEPILKGFFKKKEDVILKMMGIWTEKYPEETIESLAGKGIYLGIPVIPPNCLENGYHNLMAMVYNGNKAGYTNLNPDNIRDLVKTPKEPYFIFDVEDGRKYLGKSPEDAEKLIKKENRSCLTASEGPNLCVHSNIPNHHNVDLTASRYGDSGRVPRVDLREGLPELSWRHLGFSLDGWGSASCCSRWA